MPIAVQPEMKTGKAKEMISETTMSYYQEHGGISFTHDITQGVKDTPGQPIIVEKIELNPQVDAKAFMFPEASEVEGTKD